MPFLIYLAAAAVVVAAIMVVAAAIAAPGTTAVAEQEDQNDDPANITAAETVIVTHIHYLRKNLQRQSRSFQDIPGQPFGARWEKERARCLLATRPKHLIVPGH